MHRDTQFMSLAFMLILGACGEDPEGGLPLSTSDASSDADEDGDGDGDGGSDEPCGAGSAWIIDDDGAPYGILSLRDALATIASGGRTAEERDRNATPVTGRDTPVKEEP